jgi:hypothetical protein
MACPLMSGSSNVTCGLQFEPVGTCWQWRAVLSIASWPRKGGFDAPKQGILSFWGDVSYG